MRPGALSTEFVVFAALLFGSAALIAHACTGCAPPQLGATAAESAYTLELLKCVDDARTLAESRACRQSVNLRWGITETARDAGGDQ